MVVEPVARPGVFGSELNQTIAVTVSNASGNNKYYLDGSLTPNLAFTRGSTITFNTGDSSGNGHPFKLSSTNASGSGGTEYTDGVAYYINGSVVSGSDYVTIILVVLHLDLEVLNGLFLITNQLLITIALFTLEWVIMVLSHLLLMKPKQTHMPGRMFLHSH